MRRIVWGGRLPAFGIRAALVLSALAAASILCAEGDPGLRWYRSKPSGASGHPSAVALMIGGLNTRPDRMRELAGLLNSGGIAVLNVGLTGHRGDLDGFKRVNLDQWIQDALLGYRAARTEAESAGVPLYFVGFSLGAAIGLDLMTAESTPFVRFDKMILLAPAASVHARYRLVLALGIFGPGIMVPSLANEAYRANRAGTSIAAYRALFELIDEIQGRDLSRANIPTLLLIDPRDELVSVAGLKKLIQTGKLDRWQLREISKSPATIHPNYHHLIIDEASLGSRTWGEVSTAILELLDGR
jgi:esterase/lipase